MALAVRYGCTERGIVGLPSAPGVMIHCTWIHSLENVYQLLKHSPKKKGELLAYDSFRLCHTRGSTFLEHLIATFNFVENHISNLLKILLKEKKRVSKILYRTNLLSGNELLLFVCSLFFAVSSNLHINKVNLQFRGVGHKYVVFEEYILSFWYLWGHIS